MPGYEGLPHVHLQSPVVSLDNPDVVCFKVGRSHRLGPKRMDDPGRHEEEGAAGSTAMDLDRPIEKTPSYTGKNLMIYYQK